tara:strand:- start:92 stop:343 length:252 start_codon:yes stop_codon:yes gene_type:complete
MKYRTSLPLHPTEDGEPKGKEYGPKKIHNPDKVYKRGEFRKGKTKEEWIRSGGRRQNTAINIFKTAVIGASARALKRGLIDKL